ncbi:MAG: hypothetical protein N3G20_07050, partial [Verrucomicrobiae bacterium]|nr:hypothetical protein [Verrucomicrobiae bacterium]
PASLRIADRNNAVRVVVETPPATVLEVSSEELDEDLVAKRKATRIALRFDPPVRAGEMRVRIAPD